MDATPRFRRRSRARLGLATDKFSLRNIPRGLFVVQTHGDHKSGTAAYRKGFLPAVGLVLAGSCLSFRWGTADWFGKEIET
jgi:hypothetical protein